MPRLWLITFLDLMNNHAWCDDAPSPSAFSFAHLGFDRVNFAEESKRFAAPSAGASTWQKRSAGRSKCSSGSAATRSTVGTLERRPRCKDRIGS